MTIPAIGSIATAIPTFPTPAATTTATATAGLAGFDPTAAASTSTGFAAALDNGLTQLQKLQSTSDGLAVKAATGDLTDVHDYLIASTEAGLATQLTAAVRNKAVDAFNEIMRMQA